jgi:tetratricopeptide (TPR) repeat protein
MRDPFMLRSAVLLYENIEKPIPARMCRAHALKYEERFEDAGLIYQQAGATEDALLCFWRCDPKVGLPKVLRLAEEYPAIMNRPERHLASHYQSSDVKQKYKYIQDFIGEFGTSEEWELRFESDETLGKVIWSIIGQISKGTKDLDAHRRIVKLANLYVNSGMKIDNEIYGNLHFAVGDYETATACWEKCKKTSSEDYKKAKHHILISKYEKEGGDNITDSERTNLANYYLEKKKYADYYKLIPKSQRVDALIGVLGRVPSNYLQWREMLVELMRILAARGEWDLIIDFSVVGSGSRLNIRIRNIEKILKKKTVEIRDAIVAVCATSESLTRLGSRDLKQFSDYFRKAMASPAQWMDSLTVEAAGGAIERAGRHIDILPFYESVLSDPGFTAKEKEFARKRWIATKEKQAMREEEQGNHGPARKHMEEAEQKRREYGISDTKIAEYPNVTTIWCTEPRAVSTSRVVVRAEEKEIVPADTGEKKVILKKKEESMETAAQQMTPVKAPEKTPEKLPTKPVKSESASVEQPMVAPSADSVTFDLEGFRIQYSLIKGRININEIASMQSASIVTDSRTFRSLDVDIVRKGDLYTCEKWGMKCDFTKYHKERTVRLAFLKLDITMEFHFPLD